jgi:hypothetical protein
MLIGHVRKTKRNSRGLRDVLKRAWEDAEEHGGAILEESGKVREQAGCFTGEAAKKSMNIQPSED